MDKKEFEKLLKRYHEGTCNASEKAILEDWYESLNFNHEQHLSESDQMDIGIDIKNQVDKKLNAKNSKVFYLKVLSAAACFLFLFGMGWIFTKDKKKFQVKPSVALFNEVSVPAGSTKKILLSDGSLITLNGSSKLRYPVAFNGTKREVVLLQGEGFFDIHHDSHKMFIVEALGTRTYVLGTAFNIHINKLISEVQITVVRGKVSVTGNKKNESNEIKPIVLLPNQQVTLNKNTNHVIQKYLAAEDYTAWVQGKYKFSDESLENVAWIIDKSFNVHIRFSDNSIKKIRFSSEFEIKDKLDDLLFSICKANNLSYTINGQDILLAENHNQ